MALRLIGYSPSGIRATFQSWQSPLYKLAGQTGFDG